MSQLLSMELNILKMRTNCDIETKPFLCEFCKEEMPEDDYDFCDICDDCREEYDEWQHS